MQQFIIYDNSINLKLIYNEKKVTQKFKSNSIYERP